MLIGHTMGTPEYTLADAFALFKDLGIDGIEIASMRPDALESRFSKRPGGVPAVFRDPIWHGMSEDRKSTVRAMAEKTGVPVVTITPYVKAFNYYPDRFVANAARDELIAVVALAKDLGAKYVRVYGGQEVDDVAAGWDLAVEALKETAAVAERDGITLLVENHPGTLTVTGERTAALVREVGSPALRVLYDPANVLMHSGEAWRDTLSVQRDLIAYVHVKDFARDENGAKKPYVVGVGEVPWKDIISTMSDFGPLPPLSLEYERLWNPDLLPPAETGLPPAIRLIRDFVKTAAGK